MFKTYFNSTHVGVNFSKSTLIRVLKHFNLLKYMPTKSTPFLVMLSQFLPRKPIKFPQKNSFLTQLPTFFLHLIPYLSISLLPILAKSLSYTLHRANVGYQHWTSQVLSSGYTSS